VYETLCDIACSVVGSADRQSKVTQQRLKLVAGMQKLKHNPKHTLWVTRQIEVFRTKETAKGAFHDSPQQ